MKVIINMVDRPLIKGKRLAFLFAISIIILLYGLFLLSTVLLMITMRSPLHSQIMTASQELPQSDFARFWLAGKSLIIQRANDFGYYISPSQWFKSTFQINILSVSAHPKSIWLYPPTMNLLAMIFSFIPLAVSFWLWRIFSLLLAGFLLRQAGLDWFPIIAGFLSPAALHDMLGGQNGVLTGGLLVSALLMFDRKPKFGGIIAGLLCIKPQVAIALPMILLRLQRFKALLFCIIVAMGIILVSFIVEGEQPWIFFVVNSQKISRQIVETPFKEVFPAGGFTVFMMARSLNATIFVAWLFQISSSVVSAYLIWIIWSEPFIDPVKRMALTICLIILLAPYGFVYDLVGFSIAMAAMFAKVSNFRKVIFGILWLAGGYTITLANITGLILMPVAALAGALLSWNEMQKSNEDYSESAGTLAHTI